MKNNFHKIKDFSASLVRTALYFILMNNKVRGDGTPPPEIRGIDCRFIVGRFLFCR